jgi:hypothetical protein
MITITGETQVKRLSRLLVAGSAILAFAVAPGTATAQICLGNTGHLNLTALSVGAGGAYGSSNLLTYGISMATDYDPLPFIPLRRTLAFQVEAGTFTNGGPADQTAFRVNSQYATQITMPAGAPEYLDVCVTPGLTLSIYEDGFDNDGYSFVAIPVSANVGYAMPVDQFVVNPFIGIGTSFHMANYETSGSAVFSDLGVSGVYGPFIVGGSVRLNDPEFSGKARMRFQAGINF